MYDVSINEGVSSKVCSIKEDRGGQVCMTECEILVQLVQSKVTNPSLSQLESHSAQELSFQQSHQLSFPLCTTGMPKGQCQRHDTVQLTVGKGDCKVNLGRDKR